MFPYFLPASEQNVTSPRLTWTIKQKSVKINKNILNKRDKREHYFYNNNFFIFNETN